MNGPICIKDYKRYEPGEKPFRGIGLMAARAAVNFGIVGDVLLAARAMRLAPTTRAASCKTQPRFRQVKPADAERAPFFFRFPECFGYLSRIAFLLFLLSQPSIAQIPHVQNQSSDGLYQSFQDPPKDYDLFPAWMWNGRIRIDECKRQIDEMIDKGIKRAIIYPFDNLRTPFLSEEWWTLWAQLLAYARQRGFQLGVVPEYNFPDGEARDKWMKPPDQSRVLEGHPQYRMKKISYVEREISGPGRAHFGNLPNPQIAVAGRRISADKIDENSLLDLSRFISGNTFTADLDKGDWLLMFFYIEDAVGLAGNLRVDPLNREAIRRFLDLTLGEYYKRFKEYFGSTFTFVLIDSEGGYGSRIAWTPGLFERFKEKNGYDLKKHLPLLMYEGGNGTAKVRIDYLKLISELYANNYWRQMARWAEDHGLQMTGQSWSDSLHYDATFGGNFMETMRAFTIPGAESLRNWGRSPREYKEAASVAHFEGRRFWCENQLQEGLDSYISPQKMRYGTNMLAVWGVNLWTPYLYYEPDAVPWAPEIFLSQPHWKYFRHYTDLVRRIGYMNDGGRHVADLLLYRPIDSVFAYSDPFFRVGFRPIDMNSSAIDPSKTSLVDDSGRGEGSFSVNYPHLAWVNNFGAQVEVAYFDLMELLTGSQRDFDVTDDYYLNRSTIKQGALHIRDESFRAVILPPLKVIPRSSLKQIRRFYEGGGVVIGYGSLPTGSSEIGWDDPEVAADVKAIFGVDASFSKDAENSNARGGKSFFVLGNVEKVIQKLNESVERDLEIVYGSNRRILYSHRLKEGRDSYWVVNDAERKTDVVISVRAVGKPELWDPATGERRDAYYWEKEGRTYIPLQFEAWDATYIVFQKEKESPKHPTIWRTNLKNYHLKMDAGGESRLQGEVPSAEKKIYVEGERAGKSFRLEEVNHQRADVQVLPSEGWRFKVEEKEVTVRYVREKLVEVGTGEAAGFNRPEYNDRIWNLTSLEPQRFTLRDWWVIGPFPNPDREGFNTVYPPERAINFDGRYQGISGSEISWRLYHSSVPWINLSQALGVAPHISDVSYAFTYLYSPRNERVRAILAIENGKLWVNGKEVFAMHARPWYYELRDEFGYEIEVELKAGWNEVLVKAAESDFGHSLVFYLRFCDEKGEPIEGLKTAWKKREEETTKEANEIRKGQERWYRLEVPASARTLLLPARLVSSSIYVNGQEFTSDSSGRIPLSVNEKQPLILAIKTAAENELHSPLRFESGETLYHLGSWTRTGLTYYAGSASYEREFTLRKDLQGKKIAVDLGEVGVAAEVWVNGRKVGERVWKPFRIDVTEYLQEGNNTLRIVVTNSSDAAIRAIPDYKHYQELQKLAGRVFLWYTAPYLDAIDLNGLIGPIKLIPYNSISVPINPE